MLNLFGPIATRSIFYLEINWRLNFYAYIYFFIKWNSVWHQSNEPKVWRLEIYYQNIEFENKYKIFSNSRNFQDEANI